MNQKVLIVALALVALAGGAYFTSSRQSQVQNSSSDNQQISEPAEFAKAIESGRPTTCTITKDATQMEYNLKGKMMAAKITSEVDGKTTLSHMLSDEQYLYLWVEGQNQGTKMNLSTPSSPAPTYLSEEKTPQFDSADDYQALQDEGYTINCQPGTFSDSIFTPPNTIDFLDPTAMIKAIPSPNDGGEYDMSQLQELQKQYGGIAIPEDQ